LWRGAALPWDVGILCGLLVSRIGLYLIVARRQARIISLSLAELVVAQSERAGVVDEVATSVRTRGERRDLAILGRDRGGSPCGRQEPPSAGTEHSA